MPTLKRIISFDGGGIRGIFSLQIAAQIERLFRQESGRHDLVLADVFDFFAGTSTGAIIATFLAWGLPVADVEALYIRHGKDMFARQAFWRRLSSKYRAEQIASFFKEHFKEDDGSAALLRSKKLRKLLLVVMRNATTGSPWPICNNPLALYNQRTDATCNLNIPLWQLLRASTAAPTFFPPEQIVLGDKKFLFVDGGITPHNNPTLMAVMTATLPCYRLEWPTGRDAIHVTSIGTGAQRTRISKATANRIYLWDYLQFMIPGLLGTFAVHQDIMCRVMGDCLHGSKIDSELDCLDAPSLLTSAEQKFSYARYNCLMDSEEAGRPLTAAELQLDSLQAIPRLQEVGRHYAAEHVKREHLFPRPAH